MSLILKKKSQNQINRDLKKKLLLEQKHGVLFVRIYLFNNNNLNLKFLLKTHSLKKPKIHNGFTCSGIPLCQPSLDRLRGNGWLNDNNMEAYLMKRFKGENILVLNPQAVANIFDKNQNILKKVKKVKII